MIITPIFIFYKAEIYFLALILCNLLHLDFRVHWTHRPRLGELKAVIIYSVYCRHMNTINQYIFHLHMLLKSLSSKHANQYSHTCNIPTHDLIPVANYFRNTIKKSPIFVYNDCNLRANSRLLHLRVCGAYVEN